MLKKTLLFYGDLAPKYLTGTSIAAKTNLDILSLRYNIVHVPEEDNWTQHGQSSTDKIKKIKGHSKILRNMCNSFQPDIFYSHLPSSIGGLLKMFVLLKAVLSTSSPHIVLHLHRGDYQSRFEGSKLFAFLSNRVLKKVDHLVVLSDDHKLSMKSIFPENRTHVLENTIDSEHELFPQKVRKSNTSFIYISNYILEKGIIDLLEVFKEESRTLPITLHTYGNAFDKVLKEKIDSYDNGESIQIHGKISGVEKFKALAEADYFILPSWNEGQPIVILESMSQGTPVLASDVGFVGELLGRDYPYLYAAKDNSKLASLIRDVANTPNDTIGDSLKKRYVSNFSHKSHAEKINKIFSSISYNT